MKTIKFLCFAALVSGLAFYSLSIHAATVFWSGDGDGLTWTNAANWSNNLVPASSDDAIIGTVGTNVVISLGGNVTVQSLQCSASFSVSNGNLTLTSGSSHVSGSFTVASGLSFGIGGSNSTFLADGPVDVDGGSLSVTGGASLALPGLQNLIKDCYGANWTISGSNSLLVLRGLTNLTGPPCSYPNIQALAGGQLLATNLATISVAPLIFTADGPGSLINLPKLAAVAGESGFVVSFNAQNGGAVQIPQVTGGPLVTIGLMSGGILPTAQLQQLGGLTLGNVTADFGNLTAMSGSVLISGVMQSFPSVTNFDGGNITVSGGASVTFPVVQACVKDCYSPNWTVTGSNSVLNFPALTNLTGGACNFPVIQAVNGGTLLVTNLAAITVAPLTVLADGPGSLINLASLRVSAGENGYLLAFTAQNSGTLVMPQFTGGPLVGITVNSGGVLPTGQLRELSGLTLTDMAIDLSQLATLSGAITVSGVTQNFPAVTNLDGANLTVSAGAVVTFPALQNYIKDCNSPNWTITGSNSVLDFPALTNLTGNVCNFPVIEAADGGTLLATNLATIAVGPLTLLADGPGSLIDLRNLRNTSGAGGYLLAFTAQNSGTLRMPQFTGGPLVGVSINSGGVLPTAQIRELSGLTLADAPADFSQLAVLSGLTTITGVAQNFPAVTNLDTANFTLSAGAVVTFPAVQNYVKDCNSPNWSVTGTNTSLDFPALTNLTGNACNSPNIQALAGGQIIATNLAAIAVGPLTLTADGPGSLINLRGLLGSAGENGYALSFIARNGGLITMPSCSTFNLVSLTAQAAGLIDLSLVQGISGGACAILATDPGSVINLSQLSAFATPLAASSLTATNNGVILLNTNVFLLVNVAVNITGNPALPPAVSPGSAVSLYGLAWHSYLVESLDTRVPGATWQFYARVPLTNSIQVIGAPPPPWEELRITEFIANPPILDLDNVTAANGELVLYGQPDQTFRVETAATLATPPGWQQWTNDITMTNSFRIFGPVNLAQPAQFFRARKP